MTHSLSHYQFTKTSRSAVSQIELSGQQRSWPFRELWYSACHGHKKLIFFKALETLLCQIQSEKAATQCSLIHLCPRASDHARFSVKEVQFRTLKLTASHSHLLMLPCGCGGWMSSLHPPQTKRHCAFVLFVLL